LGPIQYSVSPGLTQAPNHTAGGFRCRRCLLKGCEQFYRPTHPQSRYCCDACRREARRWRRQQASRTWRASEPGKARRREQSRRYRRRIPLVVLPESYFSAQSAPPESPFHPSATPVPETREGQRPALKSEDFSFRWCERPGCYEVFLVRSDYAGAVEHCAMCSIGSCVIGVAVVRGIGGRAGDRGQPHCGHRDVFTRCASAFVSG
jgi:hypothetical protein